MPDIFQQLPNQQTPLRDLNIQSGVPSAMLDRSGQQAQMTASSIPQGQPAQPQPVQSDQQGQPQDFSNIIGMLAKVQQFGVGSLQDTQKAQIDRSTAPLPSDLSGLNLSPSQQLSFRQNESAAMQPTVGGLKDVVSMAGDLYTKYQNLEEKNKQNARNEFHDLITSFGGDWIGNLAPDQQQQWEKRLGYQKGTLNLLGQSIKERDLKQKQQLAEEKMQQQQLFEAQRNVFKEQANQIRAATAATNAAAKKSANASTFTAGFDIADFAGKISPKDRNKAQNQFGSISYNGLLNAAKEYAATNRMPSLGLGQGVDVKKARGAIVNYSGYLLDTLGIDAPTYQALYKANSKAASQVIERIARIDTVTKTLSTQFPRLADLAQKVGNLGITESDLTQGKVIVSRKFGSVDAGNYVELIQTMRGDYAAMQSALAGGRGGTFFVETANHAIPIGLTPEQYVGLQDTINLSAQKALDASKQEVVSLTGSNAVNQYSPSQQQSGAVNINGRNVPIGSIIINSRGQKGRVNADGSITPQ